MVITTFEENIADVFSIQYEVLSLGIQAKGKLDPYVASHMANKLNKMFKIELYHVLLMFTEMKAQTTENYDERFQIIYGGVSNFSFLRDRYRQFRDKFVRLSHGNVDNNLDEISQLLNDLDLEVGKSIIARNLQSNHYLEKLLIGLLGNPLQVIRD